MPPHSNVDVYAAVNEIRISLAHLRRQHSATKSTVATLFDQIVIQQRHMHQLDDMIDEHLAKLDVLMHLVMVNAMGATQNQQTQTTAVAAVSQAQPSSQQTVVSVPPLPQSSLSILTNPGEYETLVSNQPIWSNATSPSLIDQGDISQTPPVSDQQFNTTLAISMSNDDGYQLNTIIPWMKEKAISFDDDDNVHLAFTGQGIPTVEETSAQTGTGVGAPTSIAVPDYHGQMSHNQLKIKRKRQLERDHSTRPHNTANNNKNYLMEPRETVANKSITPSCSVIAESDYNVDTARRRDIDGKLYYECRCGYRSKKSSNFKRHVMKKHTFERPFQCEYADVQLQHVRRHQRSWHF